MSEERKAVSPTHSSLGLPAFNPSPKAVTYLVQVVGEVDDAKVPGMVDDLDYLLNDTSLPVDNGQVQRPGGWISRLWLGKLSHPEHHLPSKPHTSVVSFTGA